MNIKHSFEVAESYPLLASRLPKSWDVLVDPAWTKSTGFWSEELHVRPGVPAILLDPHALIDR